jgi:hypothetical protein
MSSCSVNLYNDCCCNKIEVCVAEDCGCASLPKLRVLTGSDIVPIVRVDFSSD